VLSLLFIVYITSISICLPTPKAGKEFHVSVRPIKVNYDSDSNCAGEHQSICRPPAPHCNT